MEIIAAYRKTKELMAKYDIRARKQFGQNFIIDEKIIDRIIDTAGIGGNSVVLEIGPGLGALTQKLLMTAKKVIAVEIDYDLAEVLKAELGHFPNLSIVNDDIMKIDISALLNEHIERNEQVVIVSNLPFYLTSDIMLKLFSYDLDCNLVVMMQKEVATRVIKAGLHKDENILTLLSRYYYDVEIGFQVSKNSFIPRPNVDSTVLVYRHRKNRELTDAEETVFVNLIKTLYSKKRKTVYNNLKELVGPDNAAIILEKLSIPQNERVEHLSMENFIDMTKMIGQITHQIR